MRFIYLEGDDQGENRATGLVIQHRVADLTNVIASPQISSVRAPVGLLVNTAIDAPQQPPGSTRASPFSFEPVAPIHQVDLVFFMVRGTIHPR
jgi:hypothetical protein